MALSFRHSAGFGKRIEYWIIGRMLKEGMDVYVPLVDDHAVDAIVRRQDGTIALVQIKARSSNVKLGDASLFAAITHEPREDYWFVFYSERLDTTWLMTSEEFIQEAVQNKNGKNIGLRSIWFNGTRTDRQTGARTEYVKDRYKRYAVTDFSRLAGTAIHASEANSVRHNICGTAESSVFPPLQGEGAVNSDAQHKNDWISPDGTKSTAT